MPRKAAHCRRRQHNLQARKEMVAGLQRKRQEEVLKNLKEATGVDVDSLLL